MARVDTVNDLLLPMMGKPSITTDMVIHGKHTGRPRYCAICGRWNGVGGIGIEAHHIVRRGAGKAFDEDGNELEKPLIHVCGSGLTLHDQNGNYLCHGLIHHHMLHLRWNDGWEVLFVKSQTDYQDALAMDGWMPLEDFQRYVSQHRDGF